MNEAAEQTFQVVDSHAHLDMRDFDPDRAEVLARAERAGVKAVLVPADLTAPESLSVTEAMKDGFPGLISAAGVHPHQAKLYCEAHAEAVVGLAAKEKIRAVGEIGLDYHYDFSPRATQMEAFRSQLAAARSARLPVIIHSRLAIKQVLEALSAESFDRGGILHCHTEDAESALRVIERGFYVSFSGILTYPRAENVREAARAVPADRLLVETDAPYLLPQALKSGRKRNEPAFVVETLRVLAAVRSIPYEEAGRLVTENFEALFPPLP